MRSFIVQLKTLKYFLGRNHYVTFKANTHYIATTRFMFCSDVIFTEKKNDFLMKNKIKPQIIPFYGSYDSSIQAQFLNL